MSATPGEFIQDAARLLRSTLEVRRDVHLVDPAPESPARRELDAAAAEFGVDEIVRRTIRIADLWTLISGDLLQAVGVLLVDSSTVFGSFSLLRASIEHSAAVCWVLDHNVSSLERSRRAALVELRGDTELAAIARKWDASNPAARGAQATRDRTRIAIQRDFASVDIGTSSIDGRTLPRPTELVEHLAGCTDGNGREWVAIYEYLCGTANHPSVLAAEYIALDDDGQPGIALERSMITRLLRAGVVPYAHALHHWAGYIGAEQGKIKPLECGIDAVLVP